MKDAKRGCGACSFWDSFHDESDTGLCRRYAPRPEAYRRPSWPEVDAADWCGEFQRRPARAGGRAWTAKRRRDHAEAQMDALAERGQCTAVAVATGSRCRHPVTARNKQFCGVHGGAHILEAPLRPPEE
jgi:hypothetical protein